MCLLIHQPKGLTFPKSDILDFVDHNADGFGGMFAKDGQVWQLKMVGGPTAVYNAYMRDFAGRECVLHFRMATHGPVTADNAHPFRVTDRLWMAHNGILSIGNPVHPDKTDTEHLIDYFIRPLAVKGTLEIMSADWLKMMGKMIGQSNKLAFLDHEGRVGIVNREAGVEYRGAWLSNTYAWSAEPVGGQSRKSRTTGYLVGGKWHSYADWRRDDDGDTDWDDNNAHKDATPPSHDTPVPDSWAVLETVGDIYSQRDTAGVLVWIRSYPEKAAFLLRDWMVFSESEVEDLVRNTPNVALDYVMDVIEQAGYEAPLGRVEREADGL